ncbi:hypothetical protein KBC77_01165 [Candidatus Saccharibacteria bacterium]|nr:hypothetical protein [Candidatus Saccharibacteria bacterium]
MRKKIKQDKPDDNIKRWFAGKNRGTWVIYGMSDGDVNPSRECRYIKDSPEW